MKAKHKVIISILAALLLVTNALLIRSYMTQENEREDNSPSTSIQDAVLEDYIKQLAEKEDDIDDLEVTNNLLVEQVEDLTEQQIICDDELTILQIDLSQAYFMDPAAKEELKFLGIDDPDMVADDLRAHPEVIMMPGVLGGTMGFSDILVLNEKYVYATMSDGHILAYGVYEFRVDDEMDFTWQVVLEDTFGSGDSDQYERLALMAYVESGYLSYLQKQDNFTLESYSIDSIDLVAFDEDSYIVQLCYYFTLNAEEEPILSPEEEPIIPQEGNFYYAVHYISMVKSDSGYVMQGYDIDYEPSN